MHWSLLLTPPLTGAEKHGARRRLLERASVGQGGAVYTSEPRSRSAKSAAGTYDPSRARGRRIAGSAANGGRSLLHHREIMHSVTAPGYLAGSLRESYGRINRLLVGGLRRLGVTVEIASPRERSLPPSAAPCFERPAAGELVVDGRKLVGSAQWRDQGAMLQHGSILVEDDQPLVSSLADDVALPPPAATLAASLGRAPAVDEVASALFDTVREIECPDADELRIDSALESAQARLVARYVDDCWTWRR
jgi:lipoate-protein ligase A